MRFTKTLSLLVFACVLACDSDKIYVDSPLDVQLNSALRRASKTGEIDHFILPETDDLSSIPQDSHNPLTKGKVELGKMLFFETGIALSPTKQIGEKTYSCASCHIPSAGFRPGAPQGIADGGIGFGYNGENRTKVNIYEEWELDAQGLRALSVLNVAFVENTTWNGRFGSRGVNVGTEDRWALDPTLHVNEEGLAALESQNMEGMDLHRMEITEEVLDGYGYREMFDVAFPETPSEERYSKRSASLAISSYLRTLLTNRAPFQEYLKGKKEVMTEEEKRGALVFFNDAKCYFCHREPNLGANEFHALGVNDLYQTGLAFNTSADDKRNLGRGGFSGKPEDMYKFKVPQLYNLGDSPFYFHGSSKYDLKDLVDYFNIGIPENKNVPQEQIARQFKPLNLTDQQVEDLVAFLDNGLRDPDLNRYVPESLPSGYCYPNNDFISKRELGCAD